MVNSPGTRPLSLFEEFDRSMMGGPEPAVSCVTLATVMSKAASSIAPLLLDDRVLIASTPRRGSPVQHILDMMENEPREMLEPTTVVLADGTLIELSRRKGGPLVGDPLFIGGSMEALKRALSFGALEYFEDGVHIIDSGPTPTELAAIESIVSDRSSRCITGSAATSCGAA